MKLLCWLVGAAVFLLAEGRQAQAVSAPVSPAACARLPFLANDGQVSDPTIRYVARTFGGLVAVHADGALTYSLPRYEPAAGSDRALRRPAGTQVIRERLEGGRAVSPAGSEARSASASFFTGSDPAAWRTAVPCFDAVELGEVYDGIRLRLRAYENNVEKVFTVAPGADPSAIRVRLEGADSARVLPDGRLELATPLGPVSFSAPVAFQERAGRREPVAAAYAVRGCGYGFTLGAYDPSLPLVIDPLLSSTFVGGTGEDVGMAVARDADGNVYVAGYTASLAFPVTNSFGMTFGGGWDAFVARLDYRLTNVQACAFLGGGQDDAAMGLAVSGEQVVLAGWSASSNYPVTGSAYDRFSNGQRDAVVSVMNRALTILQYSTYLGGSEDDLAFGVVVDASGYIQVAGQTASADFPVAGNPLQPSLSGPSDAFAARFNSTLAVLAASTFLGGDSNDAAYALTAGGADVVLAGQTWSTNFPVATNGYQRALRGSNDAFVARLPLVLSNVMHGTYLGGTNNESARAVILDTGARSGNNLSAVVTSLYVTGWTDSGNFPTNTVYGGRTIGNSLFGTQDAFLARMPIVCTSLFAGTYIGGAEAEEGRGLALVSVGRWTNDVVVAGYTASSDFPMSSNAYDRSANGMEDGFLLRLPQTLTNQIVAATYLGGVDNDRLHAVLLGGNDLYVAGYSASANYPVLDTAFEITYYGSNDVVVSRLGATLSVGTLRWQVWTPSGRCYPPAVDMQGNIYVLAANSGFDGHLYSFSPEGETNWAVPVAISFEMNSGCNISPAVDLSGNIYLGGGGSGRLMGFRPNGVQFLDMNIGHWLKTTPAISTATNLYIGNWGVSAPNRGLFSVAPFGAINWKATVASTIRSSAGIAADGTIYVGSDADGLVAYNPAGTTNWNAFVGVNFASSPAVASNGTVYIAGDGGDVYAVRADGVPLWTFDTAAQCSFNSSPVIDTNGNIYALSSTNLIALTTNGVKMWATGRLTNDPFMSPALGSEGTLYVPSSNFLYALTPLASSCLTNWVFTAPVRGYMSSPAVALDGTVYVGGMSNLYAIFGIESLSQSAWPMGHHDNLHSGNQGLRPIPAKPDGVTATKGDPIDRIRVNWNFALNASRYELYRATNSSLAAATNKLITMRGNVYYDPNITPGRRYYYRVLAKNPFGNSPMSEPDYGGIPPLPPAVVRASKGNPLDRVNVSWSLADYATSYQVWRSTNSEVAMATNLLAVSSGTSLVDTAIALGVKYYYFVRSTNEFGVSAFGASDFGGTPPQAYAPVAGDGVSTDIIPVTWPFSAGGQAFELWRSVYDIPITASRIASLATTNFIDSDIVPSNVVPCRLYYYWIKVTNEFGTSAFSPSDSGWRALYAPLDFRASDGGVYSTKVHVAWAPVPYGITYEIYRGTSSVFGASSYLTRAGGFEYDDTSITRGGTYYYWARTWNEYGSSVWVGPDAGGTPALAPTGLAASEGTYTDRILVDWQGAFGASGYHLYRGTSIDPGFAALLLTTSGNSYEDHAASPGLRYYYWARSTNVFGPSSLSASDSGYVSLSPPNGLVASDGAYTNRVNIVWNEAPGATTYEVYRNTANNTGTASRLVYTTERTYDDTLVTPGVLYYYWIRSKTASYSSGLGQPDTGYAASGLADLSVSDFVFLPTLMGLYTSPDAVSFRLRNAGPQPLFGENTRISMDFYVSANTTYGDADDVWFGRVLEDVTLPVGGETLVSLSNAQRVQIEIPYLDTGSYYVYMFVRHAYPSSYLDPNLADNVARRPDPTTIHSFAPAVYAGVNDYNGDGRADLAAYDFSNGRWYIRTVDGTVLAWAEAWGGSSMIPVLGDFDSDRNADLAVYDTATGLWYIRRLDGTVIAWAVPWGGPGFVPVWGDYNGDGSVDLAVYETATGNWFVRTLAGQLLGWGVPWGGAGYTPVMGDYNADGRQDLAVYHPASWSWYVRGLDGTVLVWADPWGGTSGFIPVPGDFDGDGQYDLAVYHAATGYWFIKRPNGNVIAWGDYWGGAGMYPVPGDYDGDGKSDLAVFEQATGIWYIRSLNGTILVWAVSWGGGSIRPVGMGQ